MKLNMRFIGLGASMAQAESSDTPLPRALPRFIVQPYAQPVYASNVV